VLVVATARGLSVLRMWGWRSTIYRAGAV
jgi:hypothetical protein